MSNPNDYTVGWICAISTELVAARAFLDIEHDPPNAVSPQDNNIYTLGEMGKHNVVIAALPDGEYGISAAASVARDMLHSFPNVRIGLMVGIGGGVPGKHDIRLGDVVVSATHNEHGGVFQYDFGKSFQTQEFQNTMFLNQPPALLRSVVGGLKADYESNGHQFQETINSILVKKPRLRKKYQRPDVSTDRLYLSNAVHPLRSNESCAITCSDSMLVPREQRGEDEDDPTIHYGLIASGNKLIQDALIRDELTSKKDVLCFEMEAAGLMNHFPCLVIRGICDYSDSHKNNTWQGYAAMTAAAYAKDLIGRIPPTKIEAENRIADVLSGVKESVDKPVDVYHDKKNIAILDWLTSVNYSAQLSDYLKRRQEGTGEWLLNSNEFQTWIQNKKQMLFCPGMPGAGKTVLTSVVADHLRSTFQEDSKTGIVYFFFNYQRQHEQTIDALLAGFLRQLIESQSSLPKVVHELYNQAKQRRPSTEELIRLFKSVAVIYSKIFIVIDALDECKSSNGTRLAVLSCIFKLQSETAANFFITSRFNTEISNEFSSVPTLEIRASAEDVQRYLSGNMAHLPTFVRDDPSLQEEIINTILQAVRGMFLVAQFHLDSLKGKTTPNQITFSLQNLATGSDAYEYIYTEAMERIVSQNKERTELARSVLSWLTFAKKPMRVAELQHALGVKPKESCFDERNMPGIELMVSVCAGLVTIDDDSNIIRLVHYTAQEYFQQTFEKWLPEPQSKITMACITYFSYEVFELGAGDDTETIRALFDSYPFYSYASHHWGDHAREDSVLREEVLEFLMDAARIESYSEITKHFVWKAMRFTASTDVEVTKQNTGLHLAAWFGLNAAVDALLNNDTDIEASNESGETPLHFAAIYGYEAIVQLLLDKNAHIEATDKSGKTALHFAAENGCKAVVQLLLDKNAHIEAIDNYRKTPLHCAAIHGFEAVVQLLLDNDADIEAADKSGATPLYCAVRSGCEAVAQLLLDNDADIEAVDENYGLTPLHVAVKLDEESLVQMLLDRGANVKATDSYGRTALHSAIFFQTHKIGNWAARIFGNNDGSIVEMLLNYGANIEAANENGKTALHFAVENGIEGAVALLLSKGANVNATDNEGKTPLFSALEGAHSGKCDCMDHLVQLLVNSGANIQATDNRGHTALYVALEKKYESVVKLLLDKGAIRIIRHMRKPH